MHLVLDTCIDVLTKVGDDRRVSCDCRKAGRTLHLQDVLWRSRIIGVSVQLLGFVAQRQSKLAVSLPQCSGIECKPFQYQACSWKKLQEGNQTLEGQVAMTSIGGGK
jgi:hypothetical protein